MRKLAHSVPLILGGLLVVGVVTVASFAPWLTGYDPEAMDMTRRLAKPGPEHFLGTDNFGRDLWTRAAFGARVSLTVALVSVGAASVLGSIVGLVAGYQGGWVDFAVMRVVDLSLGFPPLVLALAVMAALGTGVTSVTLALVAVFWTEYARVVRAVTLSEREREYVTAARALGASRRRILFRQILPGVLGPVLVLSTLGVGTAIGSESGLSFLGVGVPPPTPSWGWTLAYGARFLRVNAWLSAVPGLFILLTVLGFHLFGEGLRERLDPKGISRRAERRKSRWEEASCPR